MNNHIKDLEATINKLAAKGKGILAADESIATITKRFEALNIPSTEDTRRDYREMLVATPGLNEYVAGVILFEETLNQKTKSGQPFAEFLQQQGILPGIKVDKGLVNIPYTHDEQTTQGLDGLNERLADYKAKGACFAKWRAGYTISANTPSTLAEVTESVLHAVFHSLFKHKVKLEYIILKPSMVISGKKCAAQATAEQVAKATVTALRRTVPAAVPTINFLSGGQSPEEATANLNGMNTIAGNPWNLSYSYARALQDYSMKAWKGDAKNAPAAQKVFLARAKLNSLASTGKYTAAMEKETSLA
jgi:fructose-bisphosphate aldolase class I